MAISFIDSGTGTAASANSVGASLTVVSGTDSVLVACVALRDTSTVVTGILWDTALTNQAFTFIARDRNGDAASELWVRRAPTVKASSAVASLDGTERCTIGVYQYDGVDQSNPFRLAGVNSNNGSTGNPTVDVIANNLEFVLDSMCQVSADPDTATADHTQRFNIAATGGGTDTRGCGQEKISTGATETMGWTMSDNDNWSICAGPLQAAQGITVPEVSSYMPNTEQPYPEGVDMVGY